MIRPISLYLILCLSLADYLAYDKMVSDAGVWAILLLVIVPALVLTVSSKVQTRAFGVQRLTLVLLIAWGMDLLVFAWLGYVELFVGDRPILVSFGALFPIVLSLSILWWMTSPIKNRFAWLSHRLRLDVLLLFVPLFFIWGIRDAAMEYFNHEVAEEAMVIAIVLLIIFSPIVIRQILSAKESTDKNLIRIVQQVAHRAGVRNAKVLVWKTHMLLMNAFAIGIIFQPKTIVFTDKLINDLAQQELLAVARHEFAHHRFWHLSFLLLGMFCALLLTDSLAAFLQVDASAGIFLIFQLVLMIAAYVFLSRKFEEQADAYAAADQSSSEGSTVILSGASQCMSSALEAIANASHISTERNDVLHGSIHTRQLRLKSLVDCPIHAIPIYRTVKRIKIAIVLLLVLGFIT